MNASQAQALMNTNLTSFLRKRDTTSERKKDLRIKQIEYQAQGHINMKMLCSNMDPRWNQAMVLAQDLSTVRISNHLFTKPSTRTRQL